jgi:hypothetical protein
VDYRLARAALVARVRSGRTPREDACDAQPELLRVARFHGVAAKVPCPICDGDALVIVRFVFGPKLPPGGRCVSSPRELVQLRRGSSSVACYEVEVCPSCRWNHLDRVVRLGGAVG